MKFEWDENKNRKNIKVHGIDFKMAESVFQDEFRVEKFDFNHSQDEERYITIGEAHGQLILLTVVYTEREDVTRIISARRATKSERREYYDR